jgi:hypothetical protein
MSLAYYYNTLCMASCFGESRAFECDSKNVRAVQARLLGRIVRRHQHTWFGRKHRFASIASVRDFQHAVPLSTYADYCDAVERIAHGEQKVLTADRVRLLEPTGGSTSGEKLIPYTAALQRSFQRAIRLWIWDLYSRRPRVRRGRCYWSISPIGQRARRTTAGIPVGFDHDASYLGPFARHLVQQTMIVPQGVAQYRSVTAAQYTTLFYLLRAPDLSLISVWSPTFLTELLKLLWMRRDELCNDVARGRITESCVTQPGSVTRRLYRPLPERADFLRRVFRDAGDVSQCVSVVWPSLALVSCWADGPSLVHANHLRRYLPGVEIQPKGLLATEAFVTVPLVSHAAPALAIRSHFVEFQAVDSGSNHVDPQTVLADELSLGRRYRVIVTSEGGLYRYQLQDEVQVIGFKRQVPLLRFVGKTGGISDLVGEKLDAAHIEAVLHASYRALQLAPTFARLLPERSAPPYYVLQIAAAALQKNTLLQNRLRDAVDSGLCENPAYRYARELGQLDPVRIEVLNQQTADEATASRIAERVASGQRLGDIKPATVYHKRA